MPETTQPDNQIQDQRLHKMSSITRKLHMQIFRKKLMMFICFDLLIAGVLWFGWILDTEYRVLGTFDSDYHRSFTADGFWGIDYVVSQGEQVLLQENASRLIFFLIVLMGTLIVIEICSLIARWHGETKKIRKTLQPINEIALRADAISRLSFTDAIYQNSGNSEESFQQLEAAIANLNPEQESMPALGNEELQGIEAAMNNLLRRVHDSYQQQARFVNDASHELRTPIAVIRGYANMLDRWGREDESVLNESITAISHEAEHMNQLVEQLLFLARGDAGRTKLKQESVDLGSVMQEIFEESLMIDESHPYHIHKPAETIRVLGDPMLLKQSIRILVDNASKYTKQGDDITLSYGVSDEGNPYLQVQDSGIGMAQSDVEHMFERFYRSDETREIKGTGLGLAIAKWIVDRHRGHFEILSRTELGTRIRVVLPADILLAKEESIPKADDAFDEEEFEDAAPRNIPVREMMDEAVPKTEGSFGREMGDVAVAKTEESFNRELADATVQKTEDSFGGKMVDDAVTKADSSSSDKMTDDAAPETDDSFDGEMVDAAVPKTENNPRKQANHTAANANRKAAKSSRRIDPKLFAKVMQEFKNQKASEAGSTAEVSEANTKDNGDSAKQHMMS